jgi:hypothetical protein
MFTAFGDWFGKISPDTVMYLVGLVGALATWSYHKIKGDKTDSFDDMIRGLGKQAIHELLADPAVSSALSPSDLTARAASILWTLATRIGIPRNAMTEALITATAQHVVGDALDQLRSIDSAQKQLDVLTSQIAAFPAQLAKTEAEAFAKGKAFADEMVEKVP